MAEEKRPASPSASRGGELPKIRTMKTDAEVFVMKKNISQLDMAKSAYATREEPKENSWTISWKKIIYGFSVVVIITIAGYISWKLFNQPVTINDPKLEQPKAAANFVSVENEKPISIRSSSPGDLIEALKNEISKALRQDTIIYFPIEVMSSNEGNSFANSKDLVNYLSWKAPRAFEETLFPESNILAVYGSSSNDLAIIMKVKNFEKALAALFGWERTMWFDWKPFLKEDDIKNIASFAFRDDLIKNHDARVLINAENKTILGYTIFDKQFVIFSTSRDAISNILERLMKLPPR